MADEPYVALNEEVGRQDVVVSFVHGGRCNTKEHFGDGLSNQVDVGFIQGEAKRRERVPVDGHVCAFDGAHLVVERKVDELDLIGRAEHFERWRLRQNDGVLA